MATYTPNYTPTSTYKAKGRGGYQAGSAAKGAARGAQIGTMIMPGWGTAIGAVIGGVAGWLKGRGEGKKANEAMRLQQEKLEAGETSRQTQVATGANLLEGLRGRGFTPIDAGVAGKLLERRDVSKQVVDPLAGGGSQQFGEAGEQLLDTAAAYAGSSYGGGAGSSYASGLGISAGQPVGGLQGGFQDVFSGAGGGGGGSTGVGGQLGAVDMSDLQNLYKLRGSGTQDFG